VRFLGATIACVSLVTTAACSELAVREAEPLRFEGDVARVVEGCAACHAEGGIEPRLEGYRDLFACTEDGRRWTEPGRPDTPLLRATYDRDHEGLDPEAIARLASWVVRYRMLYASDIAHPAGFAARGTPVFHGDLLRADGYRGIEDCNRCHAVPRDRGGAVPCATCHVSSFDRCDACHGGEGDPRPRCGDRAGAHRIHADSGNSGLYPTVDCATCHVVPERLDAPGHVGDGSPRAEVSFDRARDPTASYDASDSSCAGSSCHAGTRVEWSKTSTSSGGCARCHEDPPPSHASRDCARCHVTASHLDLRVQVGSGCQDCHQETEGAHRAHVTPNVFSAAIGCDRCHEVPRDRDDPGHIDSDLPAEVKLAGWDSAARRCTDVCHGDRASPEWRRDAETVACGDCHSLPPITVRGGRGVHLPTGEAPCGSCHRTPAGEPITSGTGAITEAGRAVHVNGQVDLDDQLEEEGGP
jgi:hypothetical protein